MPEGLAWLPSAGIYLSSNSGRFMDGVRTLEQTDASSEHAALGFGGQRVSAAEMQDRTTSDTSDTEKQRKCLPSLQDNAATKHLVVQASYPGGPGYFGHASWRLFA